MATFVSILRGINVAGKNKIPMAELKTLYEELKFKNITTYIQSGNVVFEGAAGNHVDKIQKKIKTKFGFEVPVIIRTVDEIKNIIKSNPFLKEKKIDIEKLHVTFLAETPSKEYLIKIKEYNFEPDRFIISGKEVYLYCPDSYGNTKLNNAFFENKLKIAATTRNWRTVNELLRIANLNLLN